MSGGGYTPPPRLIPASVAGPRAAAPLRLHVAAAIALCVGYLVVSFAIDDGVRITAAFVSEAVAAWSSEDGRNGLNKWWQSMRPVAPAALAVLAVNSIAGGPTVQSVSWGATMAMRLLAATGAFSLLQIITDQDELLFLASNPSSKFSLATSLSLRLTPYIGRRIRAVRDARGSRNTNGKESTLRDRLERQAPVLRAAVYESLELSVDLAEAMYARGWGAGPRSRYPVPPLTALDAGLCLASVAGSAATILMAGRYPVGSSGGWSASAAPLCSLAAEFLPAAIYAGAQAPARLRRWSVAGGQR